MFDDFIDMLIDKKKEPSLGSRLKFMIMDIIEARDNEWVKAYDEFIVKENSTNKIVFQLKEKPIIQSSPVVAKELFEDPKIA